ncbi:hypothetical protein [Nocardia veterana]|uniref:Uncharacterized protein n=1 Tax=Nocardia veterana TaxID=132249 RepID=A0A7X6LY51_9NOCA|nr:hypothetical protein [Nocardia veterana]NKY86805.1 hypothetical protein [Nocardia veterana]
MTESDRNAVSISEADWHSIQETLQVLLTHGGDRLLGSARDAELGDVQERRLLDPDS